MVYHAIVPMLAALLAGVERRRALLAAPLSVVPDLDILLAGHRVYFHNIAFIAAVLALVYAAMGRRWLGVAALYTASHIVLDAFTGGVAALWPLSSRVYELELAVVVSQLSLIPTPAPVAKVASKAIEIPNYLEQVEAVSSGGAAALAIVAIVLLSTFILHAVRVRQSREACTHLA